MCNNDMNLTSQRNGPSTGRRTVPFQKPEMNEISKRDAGDCDDASVSSTISSSSILSSSSIDTEPSSFSMSLPSDDGANADESRINSRIRRRRREALGQPVQPIRSYDTCRRNKRASRSIRNAYTLSQLPPVTIEFETSMMEAQMQERPRPRSCQKPVTKYSSAPLSLSQLGRRNSCGAVSALRRHQDERRMRISVHSGCSKANSDRPLRQIQLALMAKTPPSSMKATRRRSDQLSRHSRRSSVCSIEISESDMYSVSRRSRRGSLTLTTSLEGLPRSGTVSSRRSIPSRPAVSP